MKQAAWVVTVGKRRVLAGVSWAMLLSEQGKQKKTEIPALLKSARTQRGAMYRPPGVQYPALGVVPGDGAGLPRRGVGMIPAAAWFAASVSAVTVWIGPSPQAGQVWVLAASNGVLELRADQSMAPERAGELVAELEAHAATGGVACHILHDPAAGRLWEPIAMSRGFPSRPATLDKLLTAPANRQWAVRKIAGLPSWLMPAVAGIVVVAGSGYGAIKAYDAYRASRTQAAFEQQQLSQAEIQARQREAARIQRITAIDTAMQAATATPSPAAVIEACRDGRTDMPSYLAGWRRVQLTCTAGQLSASFEDAFPGRAPETSSYAFRTAATERGLSLGALEWGMDAGTATLPIEGWPTARPVLVHGALPDVETVNGWLSTQRKRLGSLGVTVTAAAPVERQIAPSSEHGPAVVVRESSLVLTTNRPSVLALLPAVTYLTVERIEVSGRPGSEVWSVFARLTMK